MSSIKPSPGFLVSAVNLFAATVLTLLASCAGMQPAEAPPDSNTSVKLPTIADGLSISTTDLTNDGRFAKVRGRVTNPHAEEVDGIRYFVRVNAQRGDHPWRMQ